MKKIIALLAALAMSCTMLASCGSEDSSSKKDKDVSSAVSSAADSSSEADASSEEDSSSEADASSEDDTSSEKDTPDVEELTSEKLAADVTIENITEKQTDDRLFEDLVNKISETKACTMDYEISQEGMSLTAFVTMDGVNSYVDMDMMGIAVTAYINSEGSYIIDKASKKYYNEGPTAGQEAEVGEQLVDQMGALDGMEYISSSDCTIDGTAYTMETWKNTQQNNVEISYVFNADGDIVLLVQGGVQMPFLFSSKVDTSKFTLDGMTEMTEDEYQAILNSLSGNAQ